MQKNIYETVWVEVLQFDANIDTLQLSQEVNDVYKDDIYGGF